MSRQRSFGESRRSYMDRVIARVRLSKIRGKITKNAKVLDLGCGYDGEFLQNLTDLIGRGVGMDLSVNKNSPSENKGIIKLIQGRVDTPLPFVDNSFEVVTALAIIEHVVSPEMMLAEAYRVLKPRGVLLITTPSVWGKLPLELMAAMKIISQEEINDHKRYYNRASLAQAIEAAGFTRRKIKVENFGIAWLNLFAQARK